MNLAALTKKDSGINTSSLSVGTGSLKTDSLRTDPLRELKLRRVTQENREAQIRAEKLGSPFGLALGTLKGIFPATKDFAVEVGQSITRNVASVIGSEALEPVVNPILNQVKKAEGKSPFFKFFNEELANRLYGDLSSEEVTELTGETRGEQLAPIGERTLRTEERLQAKGKEYRDLSLTPGLNQREKIVTETLANILETESGPLAFALIVGYTGLDLTPAGGSGDSAIKAFKQVDNLGDALRLLSKMGVKDDVARIFADEMVNAKTTKQAQKVFNGVVNIQKTTRAGTPAISKGAEYVPARAIPQQRVYGDNFLKGEYNGKPYTSDTFIIEFNGTAIPPKKATVFGADRVPTQEAIENIIPKGDFIKVEPIRVYTSETNFITKGIEYVKLGSGTSSEAVQRKYYDYFNKKYPDATFLIKKEGDLAPILVREKGENVGLIMPVSRGVEEKNVIWSKLPGQTKPQVVGVPSQVQGKIKVPVKDLTPGVKDVPVVEVGKNLPAVIRGDTFILGTSELVQPTMKDLRKSLRVEIKSTKQEVRIAQKAEEKAARLITKNKKIRQEALVNLGRLKGNTDEIIKNLEKKFLSDEDIASIVLEDGTKLIDTVKVKRNKDGTLASVITRDQIDNVAKNYTDEIPEKWKKVNKLTEAKDAAGNIVKGIELPSLWFDRKGLSPIYDDVVEAGRAAEAQKTIYINRFKEAGLFKEGLFTTEGGWVTPARFTLSKREAENVSKFYLKRQNKYPYALTELNAREKKFIEIFDGIIKETEPRFFDIAKKMGKEPGKVPGYAPIMTASDIKLADQGGAMDWLFQKHPSFFSLKQRIDEKVPVSMYEMDYRKVASRWLTGLTDFLNYGETTQNLKYFIDSDQFKNIVKTEDQEVISNWLRDVTTVQVPKSASGRSVTTLSRLLRKGVAMGSLGLNYASVLKQMLTLVATTIVGKSRPKFRSEYAKAFGINVSDLPSITKRSGDIAISDLQGKLGRVFTGPLTRFDRKTAQVALNGLLDKEWNKFVKEGSEITPEIQKTIEKKAQDAIDMWFGGFFKGQRPSFFRHELGNTILMFTYPLTSQLNGFFRHVLKAKGVSKPKAVAEVLAAAATIAYLERVIENLSFKWSDEVEMTKDVTQSMAGNIPLVSQIAYSIATDQPFSPSPIIGNLNSAKKEISKAMDSGEWTNAMFSMSTVFGFPKQLNRIRQGIEIINEGGIRDKNGKMLVPVQEADEMMRSILRGKYGSLASKDWIRNEGESKEKRRWFVPQVEFLQNGDYDRKAELYLLFTEEEQQFLRDFLSETQQKKLDKALEEKGKSIFTRPSGSPGPAGSPGSTTGRKSLNEIFNK